MAEKYIPLIPAFVAGFVASVPPPPNSVNYIVRSSALSVNEGIRI